ncbi:hypothetical protein MKW94_009802, partial [Papaver nudicaule]|nr:hypothetical protein [Papaver nudicaule]
SQCHSFEKPFGREATRGNDFSYTVLSDDSSPDENNVSIASDNVTPPGRTEPTCDNRNMVIQSDSSSESLSNHEVFSDYRLVGAGSNMLQQGNVNARLFRPPSVSQTNATAEHNSAPRSPAQPSNEPDFGLLLQATMGHCNQFMSSVAQLNDAHNQHSLTVTQLAATIRLMTGKLSRVQQELADSRSRETQLQSSLADSRSREMQLDCIPP